MVANTKDDFAQRLNQACAAADPPIQAGRGRLAELRRRCLAAGLKKVSGESVRKWLAAESIPSMDNVRYIAAALNCETEWLLTGKSGGTTKSKTALLAAQTTTPYEIYPAAIKQVIDIMINLDQDHREKVLFAARLAEDDYRRAVEQNSTKRAGQ